MQFFRMAPRAAIFIALAFCGYGILPVMCGLTDTNGRTVNRGASSSYSPFYFYSQTLTDGWTIRLRAERDITHYVPIATSAIHLENFYQAIVEKATASFTLWEPPPPSVILRQGQLTLFVSAQSVPVPWHLIALFAMRMLEAARKGYTAGYSVMFLPPGVTSVDSPSAALVALVAGNPLDSEDEE